MYRCEQCHTASKAGEVSYRKVVATREKTYPSRFEANRNGSDDRGGKGTEIVKEILVCESCFKEEKETS